MSGADFSLIIQALAAVGTLLAVVMAIWGDWVRSRLAPPQLSVHLRDPDGELTKRNDGLKVRYYHLSVSNSRRWAPARNVTVYVVLLEERGADQRWRRTMPSGPIPLTWQFGPSTIRFIGQPQLCDLARVVEGGDFRITTQFLPNNFPGVLVGPGHIRAHFNAVADNTESESCLIEFAWNGQWSDGAKEMATNLVVREVEQGETG